tara:strand:- start:12819 stop:13043 length:225 start_codon:yes stop_codon:yes gene_type:complete
MSRLIDVESIEFQSFLSNAIHDGSREFENHLAAKEEDTYSSIERIIDLVGDLERKINDLSLIMTRMEDKIDKGN